MLSLYKMLQPLFTDFLTICNLHFNLSIKKRLICGLMLLFFVPKAIFAEGSKELIANGGSRAFLLSSNTANASFPYPTSGNMKVFVKAGETIYLGSSAQGVSSGTINLRAPDGSTYTSGTSTTVGLIANHNQELAGPLPNAGGYTPYTVTVSSAQQGVWEVDFVAPGTGSDEISSPSAVPASSSWTQPPGQYIAAFDVSVRNASNTSFLTGRVFTNIFNGLIGGFNAGFNAIVHILTKDGYQYTMNNNGQAGNGFSFFVNNKGFRNSNGAASYQSVNSTSGINVQDPRAADTQSDITHKIFFNVPAADLPATANTPGGGTTWLNNPPFVPGVSNVNFTGTEGTLGQAGTAPLGGTINFNATANGTYTIVIDVNNNGIFTDPVDRKLTGTANSGNNQVAWDGLDGQGHKVPASITNYAANISLSLYSAEVHFPFFDVERNPNGIILTRTDGINSPNDTLYWDDSPITIVGTPSNPIKNLGGVSSSINGHKWGTATTDPNDQNDFGNNNSIDSWAYVIGAPLTASVNFKIQEADLEVVSVTSNSGCVGQKANYTIAVRNNGPSDVTGAVFSFNFSSALTGVVIASTQTTGTASVATETTTANSYKASLNMSNGAVRTFTLTGTVTTAPANGKLGTTSSILRTADVTDPDATNPDSAAPADPEAECDSAPSGTGCNNIKIDSASFQAFPNAGPDQIVGQNTVATLTANTTGTWAQIGITPAIAILSAPASATTNVTGLTALGKYSFTYTNLNGCADTVAINVAVSDVVIPNIITPNGDGKNDVLEISGLVFHPNSELLIYNRWGNEVYHSENYDNSWGGKGLADGTYYYIFNRKDKPGVITTFKGWIYLKR